MLINVVKNCKSLKTLEEPWCSMMLGASASLVDASVSKRGIRQSWQLRQTHKARLP